MKDIYEIHVKENSGEEILEGMTPDFPYTSSRAFLDHYTVFWHWHKAVELFYMESGTLEYDTPQGKHVFPPGSGGLVNTGVLHSSRPKKGCKHTVQKLHIFDAAFLFGDVNGRIYQKYFAPILTAPQIEMISLDPQDPQQQRILQKIKSSFLISSEAEGYEIKLREALTDIWLDMSALAQPEMGGQRGSKESVKQMMLYIHDHYHENIKISEVAAAGFVSERECYRSFQTLLHMAPGEYVRSYRLQAASRLLAETDESITQISQLCGFGSSSFFGKSFLSSFGMTPSAYRRMRQNNTN